MHFDRFPASRRMPAFPALVALGLLLVAGCVSGPNYQQMSPAALHALGQAEVDARDYEQAIVALDRLILTYPDYEQVAEARFLLARAYYEDEQYLLAADEFLRFLERHRGHLMAPEAALSVCRSYVALSPIPPRDQAYTRQAFGVCRDVALQYGAFPVAAEAEDFAVEMRSKLAQKDYDNAEHWYRRGAYDSAIVYWEMVVDEFADTEWAPRSLMGIICAWQEIGYEDDAEEARLRLLNAYPDSEPAAEARNGALDC
jgi:outer membrane protein assembly factor BamD